MKKVSKLDKIRRRLFHIIEVGSDFESIAVGMITKTRERLYLILQ